MKPWSIFAVIPPGLEDLAAKELKSLGVQNCQQMIGGLEFFCHPRTLYKLNNLARIPSRFTLRLGSIRAKAFSELEKKLKVLDWTTYLNEQKVKFNIRCHHCKLYHSGAIQERVEKYLMHHFPKLGSSSQEQSIIIHGQDDVFTFSIDSSGDHLHRRGILKHRGPAPLRENLAAAMLQTSEINGSLWDPMCGSGTIAMEFYLWKSKTPIGKFRAFAFEFWSNFESDDYKKVFKTLIKDEQKVSTPIYASDKDPAAIQNFQNNLKEANLTEHFRVFEMDLKQFDENKQPPLPINIFCNPPYGDRLSLDKHGLKTLRTLLHQHSFNQWTYLFPTRYSPANAEQLFQCRNGGIKIGCFQESATK